uniref:Uncharacterized protein n=1 Tax=Anguilla anguilla TaxID=7936 RepID=A0A0E9URG9_ANGAN
MTVMRGRGHLVDNPLVLVRQKCLTSGRAGTSRPPPLSRVPLPSNKLGMKR